MLKKTIEFNKTVNNNIIERHDKIIFHTIEILVNIILYSIIWFSSICLYGINGVMLVIIICGILELLFLPTKRIAYFLFKQIRNSKWES